MESFNLHWKRGNNWILQTILLMAPLNDHMVPNKNEKEMGCFLLLQSTQLPLSLTGGLCL